MSPCPARTAAAAAPRTGEGTQMYRSGASRPAAVYAAATAASARSRSAGPVSNATDCQSPTT
ncbi:hypothetical protein [Actinomadura pelletieri]|uniref:hypothetical protein n=1 Tax=Actinomadura pelletieri TaxID=111805 RepID=UPI001FEC77E1|nr:hypothetical protein [Actinomadura pelletieri]